MFNIELSVHVMFFFIYYFSYSSLLNVVPILENFQRDADESFPHEFIFDLAQGHRQSNLVNIHLVFSYPSCQIQPVFRSCLLSSGNLAILAEEAGYRQYKGSSNITRVLISVGGLLLISQSSHPGTFPPRDHFYDK